MGLQIAVADPGIAAGHLVREVRRLTGDRRVLSGSFGFCEALDDCRRRVIRGVDREILWSARNMGAGERELLWQIGLPAAFPQIMTGLQVALPIALIVAIVTEMFMGGYGLGGAMNTASRFADSRGVFAGIVEIAVIGYALVKGVMLVRRRLLLWHQEALAPSTV